MRRRSGKEKAMQKPNEHPAPMGRMQDSGQGDKGALASGDKGALASGATDEVLSRLPFFENLTADEMAALASSSHRLARQAGQFIARAGDDPASYWVVCKGSAALYVTKPNGKRFIIQTYREKSIIGLSYALGGSRISGMVEALEPSVLIAVPTNATQRLLRENSAFARDMLTFMVNDNLRLMDTINSFSIDGRARLCRFLFHRSLEAGVRDGSHIRFDLGIAKGTLAARLDMSPETLSRIFAQLKEERVIDMRDAAITVRSIRDLVSMSEGL
jgi:CRP-like cAMP-binding protein